MPIQEITNTARDIPQFERLPVTTQIALLYSQIERARKLRVPLFAICEAMNLAGSKVTERYLREALSVVRRRMREEGSAPHQEPKATPIQPPPGGEESGQTPRQKREGKADRYVSADNPLLRQFNKEKE